MDNIIYLPSPDMLGYALDDINAETDPEKVAGHFKVLAERVKEHSDELKRVMSHG
jgi:hypothetical protein